MLGSIAALGGQILGGAIGSNSHDDSLTSGYNMYNQIQENNRSALLGQQAAAQRAYQPYMRTGQAGLRTMNDYFKGNYDPTNSRTYQIRDEVGTKGLNDFGAKYGLGALSENRYNDYADLNYLDEYDNGLNRANQLQSIGMNANAGLASTLSNAGNMYAQSYMNTGDTEANKDNSIYNYKEENLYSPIADMGTYLTYEGLQGMKGGSKQQNTTPGTFAGSNTYGMDTSNLTSGSSRSSDLLAQLGLGNSNTSKLFSSLGMLGMGR